MFWELLSALLPLVIVLILLYWFVLRPLKNGNIGFVGGGGRSIQKSKVNVTFEDVAGIEDAKAELQEIVDFLKNPDKYTKLGARIPKGVLCVGPPGTGKTLIAKAVSGEADCVFMSVSASEFIEVFAGMGASRIRKIFDEARRSAPCIIFIDEIDAIGKSRGFGGEFHVSNDEREQTLNQLLVEMDGFVGNEGVMIIAATNRNEVLDRALLRPGRFDRKVVLELPDLKGREAILNVHAKKLVFDALDFKLLAKSTQGASGADLANILNEAALIAANRGATAVMQRDCVAARDKVLYGKARQGLAIDLEQRTSIAYHEAGHAAVSFFKSKSAQLEKVSLIPRGNALGATYFVPKERFLGMSSEEIQQELTVLMGGRCAELLFVGDVSSGAVADIRQATMLARDYVCEFGMSDLGPINWGPMNYPRSAGFMVNTCCSDSTKERIDNEVSKLIKEANADAMSILSAHKENVKYLANTLLEQETLDADSVKKILSHVESRESKNKTKKKAEISKKKEPKSDESNDSQERGDNIKKPKKSLRLSKKSV